MSGRYAERHFLNTGVTEHTEKNLFSVLTVSSVIAVRVWVKRHI